MARKAQHGFTLVELMVTLCIIGILFGIALPAYSSSIAASKTGALKSNLVSAMLDSRSAAVMHNIDTIMCPSSDGEQCSGGFEWQIGIIGAVDLNNNEKIDDADRRLFYYDKIEDVRLLSSAGRRRLQFQPTGSSAGSNATFTFCDKRGPTLAFSLVMNNRGDLRHQKPTATSVAAACQI